MAEIVNTMVGEANKKIVDDNQIKLAMEPKLDFEGGDDGVKSVLDGATDFAWTVSVEVLPISSSATSRASRSRSRSPRSRTRSAEPPRAISPAATCLFRQEARAPRPPRTTAWSSISPARSTASPSRAARATDISVDLGSNSFIPGFEDQLIGVKAGEEKTIDVTFPGNYLAKNLAGKAASFDVTSRPCRRRAS